MTVEVVGVGQCKMDYLGIIERFPDVDQHIKLTQFSMQSDGPTTIAMMTLASLGSKTAMITKISDDHFGDFLHQDLRKADVNTSGLIVEPGKVTPFDFAIVESKTAKRKVFWTLGDVSPLQPDELRLDLLSEAKVLHVDGTYIDAQIVASERARSLGVHVVFNADYPRNGINKLMSLTDTLVVSERFVAEMGSGPLAESLKTFHAMGPSAVVITVGEDGSVGMEASETYVAPALSVQVVDTTGAGDVFQGAYIYGLLQGWNLRERICFANVAAGLKCRCLGARAGIPGLAEVMKHL